MFDSVTRHAFIPAVLLALLRPATVRADDAPPAAAPHHSEAKPPETNGAPKGDSESAHGATATADHRRQPLDIGEARPVRLDQGQYSSIAGLHGPAFFTLAALLSANSLTRCWPISLR